MPEIRELLLEAGFQRATVYWEGPNEETKEGDADAAFVVYIVAEK